VDDKVSSAVSELEVPTSPIKGLPKWTKDLMSLMGVHSLYFPCVYLREKGDKAFALWGLSYGIISDLLDAAQLPSLKKAHSKVIPFRTNNMVSRIKWIGRRRRRVYGNRHSFPHQQDGVVSVIR